MRLNDRLDDGQAYAVPARHAAARNVGAIEALKEHFKVSYNDRLSLLTIRGTTPEILERAKAGRTIMLSQTTRRTARMVVKED